MSRKLYVRDGELAPKWKEILLDIEGAARAGELNVLKVVHQRKSKENEESLNNWKRLIVKAGNGSSSVVLKMFSPGSLLRRIYYHYSGNEPYRKTYAIHQMADRASIRVAKVFGRGEVRENGLLAYSFLAMEPLSDVISSEQYCQRFCEMNEKTSDATERLASWMATRLAKMHNHGFYHHDIKPYHLHVDDGPDAMWSNPESTSDWLWIDLDGASVDKDVTQQQRVANLYQFWRYFLKPIGYGELDTFIDSYKAESCVALPETEKISSAVLRRYEKRVARSARQRR